MAAELLYLLKVSDNARADVAKRLMLTESPQYIRISTVAPLSNYQYPPDEEGAILGVNRQGLMIGIETRPEVPRDFVPWQNIAYIADGTILREKSTANTAADGS